MKSFALATLGLINTALAQNLFEQIVGGESNVVLETDSAVPQLDLLSHQVTKNNFGCLVEEAVYAGSHVEKTIKAPLVPFHMDYAQQAEFMRSSTEFHKEKVASNGPSPVYTCDNREPSGDK